MGQNWLHPSSFAADFSEPPADAYEKKSPVMKKFRRPAFKGMTEELQNPSSNKKESGVEPEAVAEKSRDENSQREKNRRNTQRMAKAIDGMLMAGRVPGDPLFAGLSPKHDARIIHPPVANRIQLSPDNSK